MRALLKFEYNAYLKRPFFWAFMLFLILFGFAAASNFSFSLSSDIFKNSAYTIAFMLGLMSILSIFFTTVFTAQILFKDSDANFSLLLYSTPMGKREYLLSKFLSVFSLSFLCFSLFVTGFVIGQLLAKDKTHYGPVNLYYYLQPLIIFGFINTLFCSSLLCSTAWLSKNRLLVYVCGLLIYILYMTFLINSGSPIMAKGMPQSDKTILLSARLDPFGLSAYFMKTKDWNILQRNTQLIPLSGTLLFNRLMVLFISLSTIYITFTKFTLLVGEKSRNKYSRKNQETKKENTESKYKAIKPSQCMLRHWYAILSFISVSLKYVTKSIPFLIACVGILFYVSMEIYGSLESGIRVPQKYATSGLIATAIIDNFHGLGLIMILYYTNELVWRSRNSNFHLLENTTPATNTGLFLSKWFVMNILIVFLTTILILNGITFQIIYHYPSINWYAYAGVYIYTSCPLIISAGFALLIQNITKHKYLGLILSSAFVLLTATSVGNRLIPSHPLINFQIPYKALYSDLNGYGAYAGAQGWLILFGLLLVTIFMLLTTQMSHFRIKPLAFITLISLIVSELFLSSKVIDGYQPFDKQAQTLTRASYEKKFRRFQYQAQPTVIDITTNIDLFPEKNAYEVTATYIIQNKTNKPISDILINFNESVDIKDADLIRGNEIINIKKTHPVATLKNSLHPNDSALLKVKFSYQWLPINGHHPFNAIVSNGSFMRISRYFPTLGYLTENELEDKDDRLKYDLKDEAILPSLDSPKIKANDFINLNMTISTSNKQTAIGIGELVNKWSLNNRRYFHYRTTSPIPFRFAISSAEYAVKKSSYGGKSIEIYYHPNHFQNVEHLLKNAKITLDYCQANFGAYLPKTIRFAEVSAFTKGFAATAYPTTIFMTENMAFNANIRADKNQDVINELAGHELSHLWWGNSQISPDEREGATLLTETLAMYTELMLEKKMYGKAKIMENVNMHKGIYLNERGYSEEQPLFKVMPENVHLNYSKGLVSMYQLAETIGEEKVNLALKNFLHKHAYPNPKPISTDLMSELYAITDTNIHCKIDDLFKRITVYNFKVKNTSLINTGSKYELMINAVATKYYEDGMGKKTNTPFNDTIEIAITFENNKRKIVSLPIIDNQIHGNLKFDQRPTALIIDPNIKFLKLEDDPYQITTLANDF